MKEKTRQKMRKLYSSFFIDARWGGRPIPKEGWIVGDNTTRIGKVPLEKGDVVTIISSEVSTVWGGKCTRYGILIKLRTPGRVVGGPIDGLSSEQLKRFASASMYPKHVFNTCGYS